MTDQTLPVKNRGGRPAASVLRRLGREGQLAPETWPDRSSECWDGPSHISWAGVMTRTPRACLNEMFGEPLHSTHRLQPVCKRGECVNPHHFRITTVRLRDGTPAEPLPVLAFGQTILDAEEARKSLPRAEMLKQIQELIRPKLEREPDLTDAELAVYLLHEYEPSDIREARTVEL